jgi:flagellar motor switch protein FliN/FliY
MSRQLFSLDETPALGFPPAFPWEKMSQEFASCFGLEQCSITAGTLAWREKEALCEAIPAPYFSTEVTASGIDSRASVVLSQQDLAHLMQTILGLQAPVSATETDMITAFHHFLSLQCVHITNNIDFDKRFSFQIASFNEVTNATASLCQDIHIALGNDTFLIRLIMPEEFRKSWQSVNMNPKGALPTIDRLAQAVVTVHIEAARTAISLQELLQLKPGDFLFLDHPFYNQDSETSRLILSLDSKPIFRTKLKDKQLTILEIPLHDEVFDSMVDKINPSFPASNFNTPESVPSNRPQEPEDDEHLETDDHLEEEEEENPFEDNDEEEEQDIEKIKAEAAKIQITPVARQEKMQQPSPSGPSGPLTPNDIPLMLVVEAGQVKISAQKLLELTPGNVIDLEISPEDGVDLVVNGRIIGKGELLKIGETIGVRIVQIGV